MNFIIIAFLIYLLYRFIVGFAWPIYKGVKQVKQQIRQMSPTQDDRTTHQQNTGNYQQAQKPVVDKTDYIDFEEIK